MSARSKIASDLVIGCDGQMLLVTQTGLRGWTFHVDDTVEHPDCQSFRAGEGFDGGSAGFADSRVREQSRYFTDL